MIRKNQIPPCCLLQYVTGIQLHCTSYIVDRRFHQHIKVKLLVYDTVYGLRSEHRRLRDLRTTKSQTSLRIRTDCYSLFEKHHIKTCYKRNFIFLACFCSEEAGLSLALSETQKTGFVAYGESQHPSPWFSIKLDSNQPAQLQRLPKH